MMPKLCTVTALSHVLHVAVMSVKSHMNSTTFNQATSVILILKKKTMQILFVLFNFPIVCITSTLNIY